MVSVLFVDDTVSGLDVLRHRFGGCNESWHIAFVPGGEVALTIMADRDVDVLVANSRMKSMTTIELFKTSKSEHPEVARIVLAEPHDRSAMLSTLSVADKCLSNSVDIEVLNATIEKAARLHSLIYSQVTRELVSKVGGLPSLPTTLAAMDEALTDEDCSLGRVSDIISGDVAMVARVLQLVNSSFYGLRSEVRDLRHAVAYLGIEALREVAVAGAVFRAFTPSDALPAGWLAAFNAHSRLVGEAAGQLGATAAGERQAGVSGTLHGLGELVVADRAPEKLVSIAKEIATGGSSDEVELAHLGTTYPLIGAYLLAEWGMSYDIVEAIACQRQVYRGEPREPEITDLVHMADALAAAQAKEAELSEQGEQGAVHALVCPSSGCLEADEDYQSRVSLLGAVRLFGQGFKSFR